MRVLVCGGRDFTQREDVFLELELLAKKHGWLTVIEGGARGADSFAREWAQSRYHGLVTVRAHWTAQGRKAGPIRNGRMLHEAKPDLVLAFPGPARGLGKGSGTGDMVDRARTAGVAVRVVDGTIITNYEEKGNVFK